MTTDMQGQYRTGTAVNYYRAFSPELERELEFKVYGTAGQPCVVFPSQNGRFYDCEDNGLINALSRWINAGLVQLFTVDSIDAESWSGPPEHAAARAQRQEEYFRYIRNDFVPMVQLWGGQGFRGHLLALGFGLGGLQAAVAFLRCPDVFDTLCVVSGVLDAQHFFGDYVDDNVLRNSPVDLVTNLPDNSATLSAYRRRSIRCSVGQNAADGVTLGSTRVFEAALQQRAVPAWFEYWGDDVTPNWHWWHRMAAQHFSALKPLY